MKYSDANLISLTGMVGGAGAALQALDRLNDDALGEAGGENPTLELPWPRDQEMKDATLKWGFVWPDDRLYTRSMHGRPLTMPVKVPPGWKVERTDHWLYKKLVDPQGRNRAQLMIHIQDHDSWLTLERAYYARSWRANGGDDEPAWPVIVDGNGTVLWVGNKHEATPNHQQEHSDYWGRIRERNKDQEYDHQQHKEDEKNAPKCASTLCRESAERTLADLIRGHEKGRDYFDEPIEFPASVGTLPNLKEYRLHCELRDYGRDSYLDGGSETLRAATDDEAKAIVDKRFARGSGYRRIYRLTDGEGNTVGNWEDPKPKPKFERRRGMKHGSPFTIYYPDGDDLY